MVWQRKKQVAENPELRKKKAVSEVAFFVVNPLLKTSYNYLICLDLLEISHLNWFVFLLHVLSASKFD